MMVVLITVIQLEAVLIQCPPGSASIMGLSLGHTCGGTCGFKGSCAENLVCQKPCEADKNPSASFTVLELGSPTPEGVCVSGGTGGVVHKVGSSMHKGVCDSDVLAAARQLVDVIDSQSTSKFSIQLVQVLSASSQVMAGQKWQLQILAGPSACKRSATYALCDMPVQESVRNMYSGTVYHTAWKPRPWHVSSWQLISRARTHNSKSDAKQSQINPIISQRTSTLGEMPRQPKQQSQSKLAAEFKQRMQEQQFQLPHEQSVLADEFSRRRGHFHAN